MPDSPRRDRPGPLVSSFVDDPEMTEIVGLFVRELPARIEALREAWSSGQGPALARLAHQLKGAAPGYGFAPIGEAAEALERGVRALGSGAADLARLRAEFDELVRVCGRACGGR